MDKPATRILVANAKGGCGKTTLATNLAACFAQRQSTQLVDLDPQGSSMKWLSRRKSELPLVNGMRGDDAGYRPNVTRTWLMHNPDYERIVFDAPAGIGGHDLYKLVQQVDTILVPVQPSPIDIGATADFIRDLLLDGKVRSLNIRLGIVANRVKANTLVFQSLMRFLKTLNLPFVGVLRDTQNYMKAVDEGLGICEMPRAQTEQDMSQLQMVLNWLDGKEVPVRAVSEVQTTARVVPLRPALGVRRDVSGSRH